VRATAGLATDALPRQDVEIRGRTGPTSVYVVEHARSLSALLEGETTAAA
jgi:hypothetical protein